MPGSIIFMGCVISRVPIGLSFMEARNKTFLVARKLLGLHHGETKWLQAPSPAGTAPHPSREDAGALQDAAATRVRPCPVSRQRTRAQA